MKSLTFRYSLTQFVYWAAASGTSAFAATYLLNIGIPSGNIGVLLATAGLLSCGTQPVLAAFIDRSERFVLTKMLLAMSALCCVCIALQLVPELPAMMAAILYAVGIWSSNTMVPLLNALSIAVGDGGYSVNYGLARGVGAAATAVASLVVGFVFANLGAVWMLLFLLTARCAIIVALAGYPKIEKVTYGQTKKQSGCTIREFFACYRRYCISLVGIGFLGMYHAMTEDYLIAIMGALGGNSSHVGVALFISAAVAAPVIILFSKVQAHIRNESLLKIAAVSFLAKAICFFFAGDITTIYLLQLFQITSYGFLAPAQVCYAGERVQGADMTKGQAFMTAAYALGCAAGGFAGGQLLPFGVPAVLFAGIIMAAVGTLILFGTVTKSDVELR